MAVRVVEGEGRGEGGVNYRLVREVTLCQWSDRYLSHALSTRLGNDEMTFSLYVCYSHGRSAPSQPPPCPVLGNTRVVHNMYSYILCSPVLGCLFFLPAIYLEAQSPEAHGVLY